VSERLAFKLTTTTEFSGTLLGFDDFVSKWKRILFKWEWERILTPIRHGARRRH